MENVVIHEIDCPEFCSDQLKAEADSLNQRIEEITNQRQQHNQVISRAVNADPMTIDEATLVEAAKARAKVMQLLQDEAILLQDLVSFYQQAQAEWTKLDDQLQAAWQTARDDSRRRLGETGFSQAVAEPAGDVFDSVILLCAASDKCLDLARQRDRHRSERPEEEPYIRRELGKVKGHLTVLLQSITT